MSTLSEEFEKAKANQEYLDKIVRERWERHEHEHQFVIPVEWVTRNDRRGIPRSNNPVSPDNERYDYVIDGEVKRVTKLRCACGEETTR